MPSYAAFLGHQPAISTAELSAVVPGFTLERIVRDSVALFTSTADLDDTFFRNLGGTIILARKLTDDVVTLEDVPSMLLPELKEARKGKVTFALRTLKLPKGAIRTLYRKCKDAVRGSGRPCRYVGGDREPAAVVLLRDAGLLDGKHGCEIVVILEEESLWVGRTIAAQDVASYVKRDISKPVRDTTVGLLPPKLAQILLNFGDWMAHGCITATPEPSKKAKKPEPLTVLDPFCGTGVIPMECLVRGWNVIASDIMLKAVNGCAKNIEWLRKEFKILKKDVSAEISKQDALKPFIFKQLPDVIVSETSLGPSLEGRPTQKDAGKMKTESERLEAAFIENCAATLPGVPLVITWPFWKIKNDTILLEKAWDAAHAAGYSATLPPGIEPSKPGRLSLLYRRPDQFVGREIVLLIPRKRK